MLSILLVLLQARGASWLVWTVVIVLFVLGITMIFFFSKRLKKGEREPEEDWTLSQRSLLTFNEPPKTVAVETPVQEGEALREDIAASIEPSDMRLPESEPAKVAAESTEYVKAEMSDEESIQQTQILASVKEEPLEAHPAETQTLAAIEESKEAPVAHTEILSSEVERPEALVEPAVVEPVSKAPETEMLTSGQPETTKEVTETTPFGDEIWSEIESRLQPPAASEPVSVEESPAEIHASEETESEIAYTARINERATVEPLRVDPNNRRESFEPPTIEPLASPEQPPAIRQTQPAVRPTAFTPAPLDTPRESKRPPETRVERPAPRVEQSPAETPGVEEVEPAAAMPKAAHRKVSGAVLGLPVESSDQPLVLGTPARSPEETGIGALSTYGRIDQEGGRWGTITLAIVVVLIAGGIVAYIYNSWFHSKVDGVIASIRAATHTESVPPPKPELPRAQIFPRRGEPDKNVVKARGAVINITEEPLTGLAVEVSLTRNDGSTESRTVAVEPSELAPRQQGLYEFDYDGKLYTGYSVLKLLSDGTEIKYQIPGRR